MPATTPDRYALGRNSRVTLQVRPKTGLGANTIYGPDFDQYWVICISEASVTLDTDTIEINSNCQSGWKIKLPSMKSGTVSGTGYIAMTRDPATNELWGPGGTSDNIMRYLGDPCQIMIEGRVPELTTADVFSIVPPDVNGSNGFIKSLSVTISPDDALRINFVIELSGSQDLIGFIANSDEA